jgi:hypothetical protein
MRWFELKRMWRTLPVSAGLVLAVACGGDNDGGTGPGGGSLSGSYQLVGVDEDGLPEVIQVENCGPARFTSGSMTLDEDGNFELSIVYDDEEGPDGFQDHGRFQRQGDTDLSFSSVAWGDQFAGEVDGDLVVLYYDFCANGVYDIDFVFEK